MQINYISITHLFKVDENQIPVISDRTNHGDKRYRKDYRMYCKFINGSSCVTRELLLAEIPSGEFTNF